MQKSDIAGTLDEIQQEIGVMLKTYGYRKFGRTFNRPTTGSLVQVVNIQMGQFPVGSTIVPGFRESFYGKFTVNLGIVLPCVRFLEHGWAAKKAYQEYDCEIRERLGSLVKGGLDSWWEIRRPVRKLAFEMVDLMQNHGLPFLAKFESYDEVIIEFDKAGKLPFLNEGRSALVVAMIHHFRGDNRASIEAFRRAKASPTRNVGFIRHIEAIAEVCGVFDL